ncbi:Bug family tripartite tricarboxylate transporter substrate binding protein [Pollutimonas harenae]|uniref:Tripartite tricarboxylate transporter substrate binding protein n=1 Tax=Pollutimonas harenae TaxID=657015 RepID=A0A853GYV6_9BURK|nr:tripartite tricarboxylate transporter substrate binding protein [Pollutimonas harenae]NYT84589.1 tripartite tricarboxylate transporter substrate binding protein [Pollutimonas harenae]TEA73019.1 tripartite tricarboxylate transporter substrate binding protein [Pollutimonas harenae]
MKLLHVATLAAAIAAGPAYAAFPEKPVHLVVPLAPGGTTDIVSRLLAEKMQQALGQPIVIENRAGAGGTIASNYVANATPDGYTILMGTVGTMAVAPAMYGSLPYDPATAFESISMVNTGQFVLVVNPEVKAKTLPELIALARENPGKINYGSAGNGSTLHLGMEMLKQRADIDMVHVPYKGSGPLVSALVGGEVQVGIPDIPSALSFIEAGRLRPLAVTGAERASFAPNIPTIAEEGFKDFNVSVWLGLLAPKGTPQAVIDKLNAAVHTALSDEALRQKLSELDSQPKPSSPDEFTAFAKSEREKWKQIVDTAGARIQ